ncbi:MAG: 6-carboxytetrahydropterin synthase, partial [Myxococcota bacterium]
VVTPGDPTTELLAALLMAKCQAILDDEGLPLRCGRVDLEETPTNTVRFAGRPEEVLPQREGWWTRADGSTR